MKKYKELRKLGFDISGVRFLKFFKKKSRSRFNLLLKMLFFLKRKRFKYFKKKRFVKNLGIKIKRNKLLTEKRFLSSFYLNVSNQVLKKLLFNVHLKKNSFFSSFLNTLERRLDMVIYRICLGFLTLKTIRQLVLHGFFFVNKQKETSISYSMKIGDVLETKIKRFFYWIYKLLFKTNTLKRLKKKLQLKRFLLRTLGKSLFFLKKKINILNIFLQKKSISYISKNKIVSKLFYFGLKSNKYNCLIQKNNIICEGLNFHYNMNNYFYGISLQLKNNFIKSCFFENLSLNVVKETFLKKLFLKYNISRSLKKKKTFIALIKLDLKNKFLIFLKKYLKKLLKFKNKIYINVSIIYLYQYLISKCLLHKLILHSFIIEKCFFLSSLFLNNWKKIYYFYKFYFQFLKKNISLNKKYLIKKVNYKIKFLKKKTKKVYFKYLFKTLKFKFEKDERMKRVFEGIDVTIARFNVLEFNRLLRQRMRFKDWNWRQKFLRRKLRWKKRKNRIYLLRQWKKGLWKRKKRYKWDQKKFKKFKKSRMKYGNLKYRLSFLNISHYFEYSFLTFSGIFFGVSLKKKIFFPKKFSISKILSYYKI